MIQSMLRRLKHLRSSEQRFQAEAKPSEEKAPLRVVLGAGGLYQEGWIPTDIEQLNILREQDWQALFKPNSIDVLLAEHVWEHLTPEEGRIGLEHCFQYLKPAGYFRIAVPDGNHPDPEYIEYVKPGGSGAGADDHKVLYTIESLSRAVESVGFKVHPLEYFDSEGNFHFEAWELESGMIHRSSRYDRRNADGVLRMTSIIIDAIK